MFGFAVRHFIPVKTIELFRMVYIKRMTQDRFRWIIILLIVKSIHTPEIRDAALGGHTGSAKKYDIIGFFYHL